MAKVSNVRATYRFAVDIFGVQQFLVQKLTLPSKEIEVITHGDTNYDVKNAGRIITGDLVLEKIVASPIGDNAAWNWLRTAQDDDFGGGLIPAIYKRNITVRELDETGLITVGTHLLRGCWVKKVEVNQFDRQASNPIMETVTISVDRMQTIRFGV